ncbi:hypothetical protein TNCV_865551 [Trichonephila clavipes]|nr:hypothetical protein TNCV_865551 [Trichonephila clavipes]
MECAERHLWTVRLNKGFWQFNCRYAFKNSQARPLDFISQFTTDVRHIKASGNLTAERLSRMASIHMPNPIDYNEIAKAQENDSELINNPQGLEIKKETEFGGMCFSYPASEGELFSKGCHVSTPGRGIAPIKYRGVSLEFPALKNAIDRCAVTLRWFRTNERKLSGQSKESALAFGSEEDAK